MFLVVMKYVYRKRNFNDFFSWFFFYVSLCVCVFFLNGYRSHRYTLEVYWRKGLEKRRCYYFWNWFDFFFVFLLLFVADNCCKFKLIFCHLAIYLFILSIFYSLFIERVEWLIECVFKAFWSFFLVWINGKRLVYMREDRRRVTKNDISYILYI